MNRVAVIGSRSISSYDEYETMRAKLDFFLSKLEDIEIANSGYKITVLAISGNTTSVRVHRIVAEAFIGKIPKGYVVDHINNNKLDNRDINLQIITTRENNSKDKTGNSKYTGVCYLKSLGKYSSNITIKTGCVLWIGDFHSEYKASRLYEIALAHLDRFNDKNQYRKLILEIYNTTEPVEVIIAENYASRYISEYRIRYESFLEGYRYKN